MFVDNTPMGAQTSEKRRAASIPEKWAAFTTSYKRSIVAFWVLFVWPLGAFCRPRFLSRTRTFNEEFSKENNSPRAKILRENNLEKVSFCLHLELENSTQSYAFLNVKSRLYNATRDYVIEDLAENLRDHWNDAHPRMALNDLNILSYYHYKEMGMKIAGRSLFVAEKGTRLLVVIEITVSDTISRQDVVDVALDATKVGVPPGVKMSCTNEDVMEREAMVGQLQDDKFVQTVSAPIAVLILMYTLGNFRFILIPAFTVASTIMGLSVVMLGVCRLFPISAFCPTMMGAVAVGLTTDYSLFMLARYKEEGGGPEALPMVIEQAGHTIGVSALILVGVCIGFSTLPFPVIANFGIAFALVATMSLLANVTLAPALLAIMFPTRNSFQHNMGRGYILSQGSRMKSILVFTSHAGCSRITMGHDVDDQFDCELEHGALVTVPKHSLDEHEEGTKLRKSGIYKLGKFLMEGGRERSLLALLAVGVFVLPICPFILRTKISLSALLQYPQNSPALRTFTKLGHEFGFGQLMRNEVWFTSNSPDGVVDDMESFDAIRLAIHNLTGDEFPQTPTISHFSGITTIGGSDQSFSRYQSAVACGHNCHRPGMKTLGILSNTTFNLPGHWATSTFAILGVDPTSSEGSRWIKTARKKLQSLEGEGMLPGLNADLHGVAVVAYDVVMKIYTALPRMIGISLLIVYMFMGLCYRSALVPLLSVLSILLTQTFVYGAAVLVYQHGVLNFLGIRALMSAGELHFFPPMLSFTIILGLGLDYDTFLIGRVREYRQRGYTHESAIVLGLFRTRKVVTAAGIIMCISFAGLMHSRAIMVNQWSFMLCTAILIDTFVVRTVVMPILLYLGGDATWWPAQMPACRYELIDEYSAVAEGGSDKGDGRECYT